MNGLPSIIPGYKSLQIALSPRKFKLLKHDDTRWVLGILNSSPRRVVIRLGKKFEHYNQIYLLPHHFWEWDKFIGEVYVMGVKGASGSVIVTTSHLP